MKKVGLAIQCDIVNDYYLGMKYKDIMAKYGVNRWNIQDALSKFDFKTDRIKSPPRLQGGKKKGTLMERYHDGDYLPPLKTEDDLKREYCNEFVPLSPYPNKQDGKPLLEDDLDIMERMDECDDTGNSEFETGSYSEIDISDDGKVRYVKR